MSTLEVSNLNDGTTTLATTFVTNGSSKVWINWNGITTTSIRDSLNVSSVTDNGTGDTTISYRKCKYCFWICIRHWRSINC
jgi:hypothetical protein